MGNIFYTNAPQEGLRYTAKITNYNQFNINNKYNK